MEHFFEPKAGQLLYHYTTTEGAAAILRGRSLWLSEFSMMNDKSEYSYARSQFEEAYKNREIWIDELPRTLVNFMLSSHEPASVMMIGCLTEERDDVGLWSRYANSGKGCVLGLDAKCLIERTGVAIRKVSYKPHYIREFVNSGLAMLQAHYEGDPSDRERLAELALMLVLDLYAFKDPRFCSEQEVRVTRLTLTDHTAEFGLVDVGGHDMNGCSTPALPVKQRQGAYGPTRFIELPLWELGETPLIRSLGFGPSIEREAEALVQIAAEHYPEIEQWKSDVPLR